MPFPVPAIVQKLDSDQRPIDDPFAAATRDISADGLGLIVEDELTEHDQFEVRITIDDQETCLLAETLWCRRIGPFHYAGFRVLRVIKPFPQGT